MITKNRLKYLALATFLILIIVGRQYYMRKKIANDDVRSAYAKKGHEFTALQLNCYNEAIKQMKYQDPRREAYIKQLANDGNRMRDSAEHYFKLANQ